MKRRLIAIDIDDVIADSTEALRLSVNKRLGVDLKPEHYQIRADYWGYYEQVWKAHGLENEVSYSEHAAVMAFDQSHITLLPGAEFAIGELTKLFDIVLITARDLEWMEATQAWIKGNFGEIFKGLHFAGNSEIKDVKTKGQQARELGAGWLIDDNPEHCQTALDEGVDAVLFGEYGWHIKIPSGVTHCKDWPMVLEYFDGIR